jgi:hypothetical protein
MWLLQVLRQHLGMAMVKNGAVRESAQLFPRTFCTFSREFSSFTWVEAAIGQRT